MSYAFWVTKRPPWVVGERIVAIQGNRVLTASLEAVVPVSITSDEDGVRIIKELREIDKRHQIAYEELTERFRREVDLLLPKESLIEYMAKLEQVREDFVDLDSASAGIRTDRHPG